MPLVSEHMTASLLTVAADATLGEAAAAMATRASVRSSCWKASGWRRS
jgi:hypothetical protein